VKEVNTLAANAIRAGGILGLEARTVGTPPLVVLDARRVGDLLAFEKAFPGTTGAVFRLRLTRLRFDLTPAEWRRFMDTKQFQNVEGLMASLPLAAAYDTIASRLAETSIPQEARVPIQAGGGLFGLGNDIYETRNYEDLLLVDALYGLFVRADTTLFDTFATKLVTRGCFPARMMLTMMRDALVGDEDGFRLPGARFVDLLCACLERFQADFQHIPNILAEKCIAPLHAHSTYASVRRVINVLVALNLYAQVRRRVGMM
jgi:hypothetical protein